MKKRLLTVAAILVILLLLAGVVFFCLKSSDGDTTTDIQTSLSPETDDPTKEPSLSETDLPSSDTEPTVSSDPETEMTETPTLPISEPTPTESSETPSPTPYTDPDFDLVPTGKKVEMKTSGDVYAGSMILVNSEYSFDPASVKGLVSSYTWKYKDHPSTKLCLGGSTISVNADAMDMLGKLEEELDKELGSDKYIILNAGYMTEAEIEASNEDTKHDYTINDDPLGSEHGTGYAVNINFWDGKSIYKLGAGGAVKETEWLYKNAARFGFIERYTKALSETIGHEEETGHFRYVGIPHATYISENRISLEVYEETVRQHTIDSPLKITDYYGYTWSVYYVSANAAGNTAVVVPEGVKYEISGNNCDGFVVTVKGTWDVLENGSLETVHVSGIGFDESEMTLRVGKSLILSYTIAPEEVTDRRVIFESSDEGIVTVNSYGKVTALSKGSAAVTVRTVDGTFIDSVIFTVTQASAD